VIKAYDQELKAGDQELGVECRCSCPEPMFFIHVDVCFPSSIAPCLPLPQICKLKEPRGGGGGGGYSELAEKSSHRKPTGSGKMEPRSSGSSVFSVTGLLVVTCWDG